MPTPSPLAIDLALEAVGDGAFLADCRGSIPRLSFVSASLARFTGRPVEELVGAPLAVLLPDLPGRLQAQESLQGEFRLSTACGRQQWVQLSLRLYGEVQGQLLGVILNSNEQHCQEGALARSEIRMRSLLDASLDVVAVIDEAGIIRYISGAVRQMLGHEPSDLVGSSGLNIVHAEDRGAAQARLAQIQQDPLAPDRLGQYRILRKDGSFLHCEALTRNAMADPAFRGYITCIRDISQRVAAEAARDNADKLLAFAAREASIGAWEWDPATNALSADDAVRRLTRRSDDDRWTGIEDFALRLHADDRPAFLETWKVVNKGEGRSQVVVRLPLADSSMRWLALSAQLQYRPGRGNVVLGILSDITQQKTQEAAAERRRADLETVLWGADIGLWTWYPLEDIENYDERTAEMIGLPANEPVRDQAVRARIHAEDLPSYLKQFSLLRSGAVDDIDVVFRCKKPDGSWRWLLERCRIAGRDAAGAVNQVRGITIDISRQRQAELQSSLRKERLESAMWAGDMGIWEWFPQRDLEVLDANCSRLYGLPEGFNLLVHERWLAIINEEDREEALRQTKAIRQGKLDIYDHEFRIQDTDGLWHWRRDRGRVVARGSDGLPERVVGVAMNIDRSKRAETEALAHGLRLDLALRASAMGLWEWELAEDHFEIDARYAEIVGLPAGQHSRHAGGNTSRC